MQSQIIDCTRKNISFRSFKTIQLRGKRDRLFYQHCSKKNLSSTKRLPSRSGGRWTPPSRLSRHWKQQLVLLLYTCVHACMLLLLWTVMTSSQAYRSSVSQPANCLECIAQSVLYCLLLLPLAVERYTDVYCNE